MRYLLVGFGSIGRRHMRNLLALGERDIIVLRSGKSTLPVDELDGFTVEYEMEKALAHRPDAAIIANPTALHLQAAIPAARAGCHLLLEKPISHSLDGLDELHSALKQSGRQALVGFQFRFHPGLRKIAEWLQAGVIGRAASVREHWGEYLPNWHPWEDYRKSYSSLSELGGGVALTTTRRCGAAANTSSSTWKARRTIKASTSARADSNSARLRAAWRTCPTPCRISRACGE